MARKMADEIVAAEKRAEQILTEAEKKAKDREEQAKSLAKTEADGILAEAREKAKIVMETAEATVGQEHDEAVRQAEEIQKALHERYRQNKSAAVEQVIGLLGS